MHIHYTNCNTSVSLLSHYEIRRICELVNDMQGQWRDIKDQSSITLVLYLTFTQKLMAT